MITLQELIKELKLSRQTIYRLIKDGMPNIRIGRVYRFNLAEVKAWLKAINSY